jgi:hypothetical protein
MHAFCGVKVLFINNGQELEEHVLDLHPLEGDHTGVLTGRLIFKALKKRKILDKLCMYFSESLSLRNSISILITPRIQ